MSRWAQLGTGLATIAALLAAGCETPSSRRCDPLPCPYATFDLHARSDSMMAWTYRDLNLPPQQTTGFVPAPPTGFDCAIELSQSRVSRFGAGGADKVDLGAITLTCAAGPYAPFDLTISLGDIRDWPAGTSTLVAPPGSITNNFGGSNCGGVRYDGLALNVTVETASGGSAPFPQLVTDDYARVFRVDFDTASVTPQAGVAAGPYGNDKTCDDFPMTGAVSLHLAQTRADYAAYPDAVCQCID